MSEAVKVNKQYIDFKKEPGRPSVVLKKYAEVCKDAVIDLKDRYGNPKFVTDDVIKYREKVAAKENSETAV